MEPVIVTRGLTREYEGGVQRAARRRRRGRRGRVRRRHRAVRLREVDAAEPARRAGPADRRARSRSAAGASTGYSEAQVGARAPRRDRLRVPVLQPDREPLGGRQRRAAGPARPASAPKEARNRREELLDPLGIAEHADAVPHAPLRRPAAARGDRPRADQPPERAAGRRADRQPGLRERPRRDGAAARGPRRATARRSCSSPTTRASPPARTACSRCATARSPTRPGWSRATRRRPSSRLMQLGV